jgi:hypothetical protein
MKKPEILKLRIKKENLIEIVSGRKVEEYRDVTNFYANRFYSFKKKEFYNFDEVYLYCGNVTDTLFCRLKCKKILLENFQNDIPLGFEKGQEAFTIYLGEIIHHNLPDELLI